VLLYFLSLHPPPGILETSGCLEKSRKVDVRLPGKGKSNSHGTRPVHLIITMIKWIRTSRLSIKNSLSGCLEKGGRGRHSRDSDYEALGQLGQDEPASG